MEITNMLDWFNETKNINVKYNDIEYENIRFNKTKDGSGYYKNGFKTHKFEYKNNQYLQIDIYTVAGNEIDIEERFLFLIKNNNYIDTTDTRFLFMVKKQDYVIKKWVGWDNTDLLKFDNNNEWVDMLKAIYIKNN